jgi:hypothetical protein
MIIGPTLPTQKKLSDGTKKLITVLSSDIIKGWPPFPDTTTQDSRNVLVLVNAFAFVTQVFKIGFQSKIHADLNEGRQV